MPNDFHAMRAHNRVRNAKYRVHLEIQRDDAVGVDPTPKRNQDGSYTIPIVQPTDDARHTALGRFMDEWSKMEMALSLLLANVTATPWESVNALMNALGTRNQIDVLRNLAPIRLPRGRIPDLDSLLDRIKSNNTKRNNIVHGYWMLEIVVIDSGGTPKLRYHQYREYAPSDPELQKQLWNPSNRRIRSKFLYSITRINSISRELQRLCLDIQNFNSQCFARRVRQSSGQSRGLESDPPATDQSQSSRGQSTSADPDRDPL